MDIRKMQPSDYEEAIVLWQGIENMGLRELDDSKEGFERFLRRNPELCFVAEEGGRMVATILCGHDGRRGHIYHMAVLPAYRRRSIGQALVERAVEALGEEGIWKVTLVVFGDNEPGNQFWESMGFGSRKDLVYRDRIIPTI